MRVRQIVEELNVLHFSYHIEVNEMDNNRSSEILNLNLVNTSINEIAKFGFIDSEIEVISSKYTSIYHSREEVAIFKTDYLNGYVTQVKEIEKKTGAVIDAFRFAIEEQKDNMISIKLPAYVDLKKVSRFISDVDNMVRTVIPPNKPTSIKLNNFDTGSNWIEIVLDKMENVLIVADFIALSTAFAKTYLLPHVKSVKDIEQSKSLEEDVKKVMLDGMKSIVEEKAELSVGELLKKGVITVDDIPKIEEYKNGLNVQLVKTANYILEGAEYRPALNAPNNIQEQFPDNQDFKHIQTESSNLYLTHHDSEDEGIEEDINIELEDLDLDNEGLDISDIGDLEEEIDK